MNNRFSAAQIAIIGAIVLVIADVIALIAAVAAYDEQQASNEQDKHDIQNQITELQGKLSRYLKK